MNWPSVKPRTADTFHPRRREVDLRLVPMGFAGIILIGTLLLMLPWTHRPGHDLGWLDALFLATSATCVTGLTTVSVAETFNGFGEAVLLVLIQAGGVGIFTASITLVLLSGNRLSLSDEQAIHTTFGRLKQARPLVVFLYACLSMFILEAAGMTALFALMRQSNPDQGMAETLWEAGFHSVSAFCNAGITTYPDGMMRWRDHPGVLAVIECLVIAGSIGLMTLINLRFWYFWRRDPRRRGQVTLQTKLCLVVTFYLLLGGALMTWLLEMPHTLADASDGERVSWAFFQSSMRTAGFNVVEVGDMHPPTLLGTILLMFIGGAPGSMAGGIKITTFAVLLLTAWAALRRRGDIQVFGRRIAGSSAHIALLLSLLSSVMVMAGVGLLMLSEDGQAASQTPQRWLALIFEAVSAYGTVGFSMGVTPLLTPIGKLIILLLMFTGRIAPLMLAIYLARPANPLLVRHAREDLALG